MLVRPLRVGLGGDAQGQAGPNGGGGAGQELWAPGHAPVDRPRCSLPYLLAAVWGGTPRRATKDVYRLRGPDGGPVAAAPATVCRGPPAKVAGLALHPERLQEYGEASTRRRTTPPRDA